MCGDCLGYTRSSNNLLYNSKRFKKGWNTISYDSSERCFSKRPGLKVYKKKKVSELEEFVVEKDFTRAGVWSCVGRPLNQGDRNAHPRKVPAEIAMIHNGIIENYAYKTGAN